MAPEQTRADPATSASDVFSLGIVLYELVTGKHPFLSDSPIDTAQAIANADPKPPAALNREIPPAFNSLLLAMLAKDPDARPSAAEVERRLAAIEAASAKQRSRRFRWLVGVSAICMIVGLALWLMRGRIFPPKGPALTQLTTQASENRVTAAALSPDGKTLAFAVLGGSIYLRHVSDGSEQTLSKPTELEVERIAWFSDGTRLAVSGFSTLTNVLRIWIISTTGAPPRMLRERAREAVPSPDGREVVFITTDWSEIWLIGANGEKPHRIVAGPYGDIFQLAFWSPDSRRVSYQRRRGDGSTAYESLIAAAPTVTTALAEIRMSSASALPDGRILFLQSNPPDSKIPDEMWEVKTDLTTGRFVGIPSKIASWSHQNETQIYGLSSSADGKQVAVLRVSGRGAVFVGDFNLAPPRITRIRRLTLDDFRNWAFRVLSGSRA